MSNRNSKFLRIFPSRGVDIACTALTHFFGVFLPLRVGTFWQIYLLIVSCYVNSFILIDFSGECNPGFFCLEGASSPNNPTTTASSGPCPIGKYCPRGTSYPLGCPPGSYMNSTGQDRCFDCIAGFYCPANTTSYTDYPCPTGHYCTQNVSVPVKCPSGTFRNITQGTKESDCQRCLPGFYCEKQGLSDVEGKCGLGHYCIHGAKIKNPIGLDNYTSGDCVCPSNMTGM